MVWIRMVTAEELLEDYTRLETSRDLDPMLASIGQSKYVLLGEASHGTHEYYTWRTAISKRLIMEKDFSFIAVEGDWPDCYRINRYVKGHHDAGDTAIEVLKQFKRWPTWMWANWEIAALMEWMRELNKNRPANRKVGFYGLDVYSLWESMHIMVSYLRKEDPTAAKLVIDALRCFEPYEEGHDYARGLIKLSPRCKEEVIRLSRAVRKHAPNYNHDPEASLNAEMNVSVIANAEEYYRSMVSFSDQSWNIRDSHMMETLDAIMKFHGKNGKCIVWAHNTHVGDVRYTSMRDEGMWNIGQLAREKHSDRESVFLVGFAAYQGSVIAGRAWGATMERMEMPPAIPGSIEDILHSTSQENKLILLDNDHWKNVFRHHTGHRAVGVVYDPGHERGNYVPSLLPSRYDALIYVDQTSALHPLHLKPDGSQVPETYPFGF